MTDPRCHCALQVAELEVKVENLYGNGQPGRVSKLEDAVDAIGSKLDRAAGAVKVWGIVASATWAVLMGLLVAHLTGRLP